MLQALDGLNQTQHLAVATIYHYPCQWQILTVTKIRTLSTLNTNFDNDHWQQLIATLMKGDQAILITFINIP